MLGEKISINKAFRQIVCSRHSALNALRFCDLEGHRSREFSTFSVSLYHSLSSLEKDSVYF